MGAAEKKSCGVCKVVRLLAGLGALNWGLVGLFETDLVASSLGVMTTASRVVYGVIGLAGLVTLVSLIMCCPCGKKSCEKQA